MVAYTYLAVAILAEVVGTVSLRYAEGFTRPVPSVVVILCYVIAFLLLSRSLAQGVPLAVAYGIWSAVGVALVALIGVALFGEGLTVVQVLGVLLIIGGVVAIEAGGSSPA